MENCLFCKIIQGDIPAKKVYETDMLLAFYDINPQAPVHVQIIPKMHIGSTNEADETHQEILGSLVLAAKKIAGDLNISSDGYRLVLNCGKNGGQQVSHIHLHLLGGRIMNWPPG
jgi:histidine triad (HIT) family protein